MTDETKEIIEAMNFLFTDLNKKMDKEFKEVKDRITKLETTQENVIGKNIKLLAEGFSGIADKIQVLDKIEDDLSKVKMNVDVINNAIVEHSNKITKLTTIK